MGYEDKNRFYSVSKLKVGRSEYPQVHNRFIELIKHLMDENPEDNIEAIKLTLNYKSLRGYSREFKVARGTIKFWLKKFLIENYGKQRSRLILETLWSSVRPSHTIKLKKKTFEKEMLIQLRYYPNNIDQIKSLNELAAKIGVTRITLTEWMKVYLEKLFGKKLADSIFKQVWTERRFTQDIERRVKYDEVKSYVQKKEGKMLTIEEEFNLLNNNQSKRLIRIMCKKNHKWLVRVSDLIYPPHRWCPMCSENYAQKAMRKSMEEIFSVEFPETSLNRAYGLSKDHGGFLRFDGYNDNVNIKGKRYKVAFEYDGLQHDIWPNKYHKNEAEFKLQRKRDKRKMQIAEKNQTIIIRLKKKNGFDIDTAKTFHLEIEKQFEEITGLKIN